MKYFRVKNSILHGNFSLQGNANRLGPAGRIIAPMLLFITLQPLEDGHFHFEHLLGLFGRFEFERDQFASH